MTVTDAVPHVHSPHIEVTISPFISLVRLTTTQYQPQHTRITMHCCLCPNSLSMPLGAQRIHIPRIAGVLLVSASCQQLLLAISSRQRPSRWHQAKLHLQGQILSLLFPRTWRRSLSFLTLFFIIANTHYNITSTRLPNTPAQYHLQQADHANIYVSTTPNNYRRQRQITYNHFHTFSFARPTFATLEQQYQTSVLQSVTTRLAPHVL